MWICHDPTTTKEVRMSDAAVIVHKTYFEGTVQSLGCCSAQGRTSVGVVLPGSYDFGVIQTTERITITGGSLRINGRDYCTGETAAVEIGEQVVIIATEVASYLCLYGR